MENLSVSLSQYALSGMEGFGDSSQQDLNLLSKALTAGSITGRDTENQGATGGSVLKVESLENTLKVLNFAESDIVLWKAIPKTPAYNTVEEYNQLIDYGATGSSFNNEGETPKEDDATYARKSQLVKFMGTTRSVSHPMQLVNVMSGIGNVVQSEVKNGTMKILRDVNKAIVTANSAMIPQEFDGMYTQHQNAFQNLGDYFASEVVIDLKGKALKDADVGVGALAIVENHGDATDLFAPPSVLSNYATRFLDSKLISPNTAQTSAAEMGQNVSKIWTQFGSVNLNFDKFLSAPKPKTVSSNPTNVQAPSTPTVSATVVADTNATSYFGFTGDYSFAVSAVNRHGESGLGIITAPITVGVNQSVNISVTPVSSVFPATSYNIYKTKKNAVTGTLQYFYLFSVSSAELAAGYDGAAANLVKEKNRIIPGTQSAFMIEKSEEIWNFKQLAPLMKMDLAQVGPATRFMILLYGTPILYAPKKMVKFINIGSELI